MNTPVSLEIALEKMHQLQQEDGDLGAKYWYEISCLLKEPAKCAAMKQHRLRFGFENSRTRPPANRVCAQDVHALSWIFTARSMGDDEQPELHARMANYHTSERPAHHALHDANSLRIGVLYALENGWQQ